MADKRRRKSLNVFRPKPETSPTLQITTSSSEKRLDDYPLPSPVDVDQSSPRVRPRTLQKSNRTSVFGSLRSLHSLDEEDRVALTRSDSKASSLHDDELMMKGLFGDRVLQYGEVQDAGGNVFRKRSRFLVLTDTHLIRFRSQAKAVEMFPTIPSAVSRGHAARNSSVSSYQELQLAAYTDITSGVSLEHIIAVYRIFDEGRALNLIDVAYTDERTRKASILQFQVNDVREAEVWTGGIRSAARSAITASGQALQSPTVEYLARLLEKDRDYDPEHFHAFKVVQRSPTKSGVRTSAEDLTRFGSTICYLVIGLHNVHLIPINRSSARSSSSSLNDVDSSRSFGIVTLASVKLRPGEDDFRLIFKPPLGQPHMIQLASLQVNDIALLLRYSSEYLRPEWIRQPFVFDVPPELEDRMDPPDYPEEDHNCFDRTLIAYCAGYGVDTSRICYSVDYQCEDDPCFQLLPPSDRKTYSALELLAVFRALRYNESFTSISFARIDLSPLRNLYDTYGTDQDSLYSRSGHCTNIAGHEDLPVLSQEIRGLALKSRRLRRFDFSYSIPSRSTVDDSPAIDSGIPEALAPLCKRSLTNVDWIILTGVRLADSDLNYLVDAASERACHFRALEIGDCGLSIHDVDVLLSALACQDTTMEVINISGALGRFSPELFQRGLGAFSRIRRLNLTRVQKTAGPEPLIAPDALLAWRLEELHLSQTALNEQTVDSVSTYLGCPKSEILRDLQMNQCGLTGRDLATFFLSMTQDGQPARAMHVSANENRLKIGSSALFQAIGHNRGPTSLSMRMMDFEKESHFRELIRALTSNSTLRSLDISRASLPYDASVETCEALKEMFATNQSLEELDISGEQAHLDATRFGIGLNIALRGLENNKTLKLLRIEHQLLGLQGANTLAEVLRKNDALLEIHCEHNDINLQSFTVLVDALEHNMTLLYMPTLNHDRAKFMEKIRRELEAVDRVESPKPNKSGHTLKKTFGGGLSGRSHRHSHGHSHNSSVSSNTSFTDQDVTAVIATLEEKWNLQEARMQNYLYRNYCLARGDVWQDDGTGEHSDAKSGAAGDSMAQILQKVKLDRTPTVDNPSISDYLDEKLGIKKNLVFPMPDD